MPGGRATGDSSAWVHLVALYGEPRTLLQCVEVSLGERSASRWTTGKIRGWCSHLGCCHVTGRDSRLQAVAADTALWSDHNGMQRNVEKNERDDRIIFKGTPARGHSANHNRRYRAREDRGGCRLLERTKCAKVPGVMISSDFSWQSHVNYVCPSASRHFYFLTPLKRAGAWSRQLDHQLVQSNSEVHRWVCLRRVAYGPHWWTIRPDRVGSAKSQTSRMNHSRL